MFNPVKFVLSRLLNPLCGMSAAYSSSEKCKMWLLSESQVYSPVNIIATVCTCKTKQKMLPLPYNTGNNAVC